MEIGRPVLLLSRATFAELTKVLAYPKFGITEREITALLEDEILPYCDVVETVLCEGQDIHGICRDPGDDIFLACAAAAGADAVVTGDQDLLALGSFRNIPVLPVSNFLK